MPNSPATFVSMSGKARLTEKQLRALLRVLSEADDFFLSPFERKDFRAGVAKLKDAQRRLILGSDNLDRLRDHARRVFELN